jgi:S1-C subfamily serine protease
MRPVLRAAALGAFLLLRTPPVAAEGDLSREELVKLGKPATALVECTYTRGRAHGSAFCVHPSGLFATNAHVVTPPAPGLGEPSIALVLNPSLGTQRVLPAKLVRVDKDKDLALLKVEGVKDLPALSLGTVDGVTETTEVIAFGFPFGTQLSENKIDYPAVSVNVGSVTSLRQKEGALHRIQVDVVLNPGNSGGPVLDRKGKVVGVVVAGVRGAQVNFLIPVSHLAEFVEKPELDFKAPAVARENVHREAVFEARALSVLPDAGPLRLELVLKTEDGKERRLPMEPKDGVYRVRAVPLPPPEGPVPVRVIVTYANGSVTGTVPDRPVKVGDRERPLSEVRSVRRQPPQVVLGDGRTVAEPFGLDSLEVPLGKEAVRLKLDEATALRFEPVTPAAVVSCTVIARRGNAEVGRLTDALAFAAPAAPADNSGGPTGTVKVVPAPLEKDRTERTLPAPVSDVAVGGNGRYLILLMPRLKQLAIFDTGEAKVVGYIPVAEDNARFAAGMDKVLVALPRARVLQRWDLATRERELTVPLPLKEQLARMAMGSASQGPLLISGNTGVQSSEVVFVDVKTLKPIDMQFDADARRLVHADDKAPVQASADGRVFTSYAPQSSPQFVQVMVVDGNRCRIYGNGDSVGHLSPSADGRYVYTARGIFTQEAKRVVYSDRLIFYGIAAAHGPYFVAIRQDGNKWVAALHMAGEERPLLPLPDVEVPDGIDGWDRLPLGIDRRIHFIPEARLLVVLPGTNDKLVLYKLDVDQALEKAGLDYLFVTTAAPEAAAKGQPFAYQVGVKSRKGGVTYRLDSAPTGMGVTKEGLLKWDVPADFADKETTVILSVGDKSGQEVFHTFTLKVR